MAETNELYWRQLDIIKMDKVQKTEIMVVGAGAIGSFATLTLAKEGVRNITVYDDDGVDIHNLPNQFYRLKDINTFKLDALHDLVSDFADISIVRYHEKYVAQMMKEVVICAPDNMVARKDVWQIFQDSPEAKVLIEARMGSQQGSVYMIRKVNGEVPKDMIELYEGMLFDDKDADTEKCTERAIIDTVLMISSLVARASRAYINEEREYPAEVVFDLRTMNLFTR